MSTPDEAEPGACDAHRRGVIFTVTPIIPSMIDRYARPQMKAVWSEDAKMGRWLAVELAVCEEWQRAGVIPQSDLEVIRTATFTRDLFDLALSDTGHEMTAFIRVVAKPLGAPGRWIHFGLTSSDVMDTALALQLRDSADILLADIDALLEVLANRALEFKPTLQMGRTHGIHAEPITFGLKLALWWEEMRRNRQRLEDAKAQVSVGKVSGPVGTHATVPLDVEEGACRRLGVTVAPLSNQIVQRDRHAHFVTTLALIAASLEKFATEIRNLQRTEIQEVEEAFGEGQTGSSSMPHKRNPELSERVCGLARLTRGQVITALENVALWHERDISHSSAERVMLPDACLAVDYILDLFMGIVRDMRVYPDRMMQNLESTHGLVFSQRVMLLLVEKGMDREDAYRVVQAHAHAAWDGGADFGQLLRDDQRLAAYVSTVELNGLFDYDWYIRHVDALFERAGIPQAAAPRLVG